MAMRWFRARSAWTGTLVVSLVLAGCRTPPVPRTFLGFLHQITQEVKPRVGRIMGTRADVTITVGPTTDPNCYGGTTADRKFVLFDPGLRERFPVIVWHYVVAHEMVHVHTLHHWETIPMWLEEGLAELIAMQVIPEAQEFAEAVMRNEYERGYRLVKELGIEGVRALAMRAHKAGLDQIPDDWLLD